MIAFPANSGPSEAFIIYQVAMLEKQQTALINQINNRWL
jgi:hypothetical protein